MNPNQLSYTYSSWENLLPVSKRIVTQASGTPLIVNNSDFSFSSFQEYELVFSGFTITSDNSFLTARVGSPTIDSGGNYDWVVRAFVAGTGANDDSAASATSAQVTADTANYAPGSNAANFGSIRVRMISPSSVGHWRFFRTECEYYAGTTGHNCVTYGGFSWQNTTSPIQALAFDISGGNWSATLDVYGRNRILGPVVKNAGKTYATQK